MNWTKKEKEIAKKAFALARQRDYHKLINEINAKEIASPDDVWNLREFLNLKAKEFDARYDYRYSVLLDVFMDFVALDLLSIEELKGLSKEKYELIESSIEVEIQSDDIYELKITIEGTNPPIYRIIHIENNTSFYDLHTTIQLAFGWDNAHLHEFRTDGKIIGMPEMDEFGEEEILEEKSIILKDAISFANDTCIYIYDFGDDWCHKIELTDTLPKSNKQYPRCTSGKRCRPPEDVGSIRGFEDFKAIMKDKNHEEHDEMLMWYGGEFDPNHFSLREINTALKDFKNGEFEIDSIV